MKNLLFILLVFISVNGFSQQKLRCDIDTDHDGIADCFDKCANTTLNVNVNSHGCPFDTDGDGVADYLDQQLITPTECQPSDSNGVGVCPEPKCPNQKTTIIDGDIFGYKKYNFSNGKIQFDNYIIKMLDNLSNSMKANPSFKVVIAIYGNDFALHNYEKLKSKIISYLDNEKGIDIERFIFIKNSTNERPFIEIRNPNDGEE